ncbi:hypothetical protein IWX50DRAFT_478192 [Phyllosticta citricarpa]|uniref:Uncharacterized protein n=1 Tax=Phyllosticta citricarpa TaxID=55181 RepID=A0ABR1L2B7_9PEZI
MQEEEVELTVGDLIQTGGGDGCMPPLPQPQQQNLPPPTTPHAPPSWTSSPNSNSPRPTWPTKTKPSKAPNAPSPKPSAASTTPGAASKPQHATSPWPAPPAPAPVTAATALTCALFARSTSCRRRCCGEVGSRLTFRVRDRARARGLARPTSRRRLWPRARRTRHRRGPRRSSSSSSNNGRVFTLRTLRTDSSKRDRWMDTRRSVAMARRSTCLILLVRPLQKPLFLGFPYMEGQGCFV